MDLSGYSPARSRSSISSLLRILLLRKTAVLRQVLKAIAVPIRVRAAVPGELARVQVGSVRARLTTAGRRVVTASLLPVLRRAANVRVQLRAYSRRSVRLFIKFKIPHVYRAHFARQLRFFFAALQDLRRRPMAPVASSEMAFRFLVYDVRR